MRTGWIGVAAALALACASPPLAAQADQAHAHHRAQPAAGGESRALGAMSIPDAALLDQDGREVRFYSDLIAGRVVAINFIFTTCTTICPPMGAIFSKLQQLLRQRPQAATAERAPALISVSVDPAVDTPPRLRAWASKFGREEGWTLVTGPKTEVDRLLKALGAFTADKDDHSPVLLLGDDARGEWTRAYGLASPAKLAEMIGELLVEPASARPR